MQAKSHALLSLSLCVCLSLSLRFFFFWFGGCVSFVISSILAVREGERVGETFSETLLSPKIFSRCSRRSCYRNSRVFLILEFQAHFPSLCNAKVKGFIILEFPRHIHTYFQLSLHNFFISSGYQLWRWKKVEFLCWIVSALVALLYFNPAQFF